MIVVLDAIRLSDKYLGDVMYYRLKWFLALLMPPITVVGFVLIYISFSLHVPRSHWPNASEPNSGFLFFGVVLLAQFLVAILMGAVTRYVSPSQTKLPLILGIAIALVVMCCIAVLPMLYLGGAVFLPLIVEAAILSAGLVLGWLRMARKITA